MSIHTLLGEIAIEALGRTYIHEHILTNPPPHPLRMDPDFKLDDSEKITQELILFHEAGGQSLMDCTALDYGRDIKGMLEIAKRVPVNILALTGFNRGDYMSWVKDAPVEKLEELILRDIQEGMDGTKVKAAVIKIGTCYNVVLDCEYRIMEAAGRAHRKTKRSIITHTTLGTMGLEQIRVLDRAGVDPHCVALSHLDQNLDFYYLRRIAKSGAYIEFDGPSKVKYAPDSARIEMLKRLCDAGYEDQLLISGDMGRKSYLTSYGGGPGFRYLLGEFVPRLLDEGFTQNIVDKFFVHNPANFLCAGDNL